MDNHQGPPFYGKYQGTVADTNDPEKRGRLRAYVPDVYGDEKSGWALPSVPYAGKGVGLWLIPPEKACVWIEFEGGNPDDPIWSGCFWAQGEAPATSPGVKVLKTKLGTLTLDDSSGGSVTLETSAGCKIVMESSGVEITDGQGGQIKLSGPQVSVNDGALEVT